MASAVAASERSLRALKDLEWATPLREVKISVSKLGDQGWYQAAEDLYISTVPHHPRSGNYLDDPRGPFVMTVAWTRCREAISVLMGDRDTVNCTERNTPPALLLPAGADGTYRSIIGSLDKNSFWDRTAYTGDDRFKYRTIANANEAYTYYFSSQAVADGELPFAVVYLLENGRER